MSGASAPAHLPQVDQDIIELASEVLETSASVLTFTSIVPRLALAIAFLVVPAVHAQTAPPVAGPSLYAELGGPGLLSAGLEVPVSQIGASSVFVRGGIGVVPRILGDGAITTVPLALGVAVGKRDALAVDLSGGGVLVLGWNDDPSTVLAQAGVNARLGLGRGLIRGGGTVLADPTAEDRDEAVIVVPSLAVGVRM